MKRLLVNMTTRVNREMIRRETRNGDEFVIIRSATLPDNIVMNGGLYPDDEIEKSYMTLNGKLAPLEHPQDAKGNYISANSQYAIDNYYVGAANENVTRDNGRVFLDKAINVKVAMSSDKGKRVMDRITAIESGNGEPIHTSTGVLLNQRDEEGINAQGQEYTWVAENMVFDHDCILLDEPGAATPEQGVGIAVNAEGDKFDVQFAMIEPLAVNADDSKESLLQKVAEFLGIAEPKKQAYNSESKCLLTNKGDPMKNLMMEKLKKANLYKDDMDDDAMMNAYDEMMKSEGKNMGKKNMGDKDGMKKNSDDNQTQADVIAAAVTNALAPVVAKVDALQANADAAAKEQKQKYIDVIVNSKTGYEAGELKDIPETVLAKIATNCAATLPAHMLSTGMHTNADDSQFNVSNMEAPE